MQFGKVVDGKWQDAPDMVGKGGHVYISPSEEIYRSLGYIEKSEAVIPDASYNKYLLGRAIDEAGFFDELIAFFADYPKAKFHWDNAQEFVRGDKQFETIEAALKVRVGEDGLKAVFAKYDELKKTI